MPKTQGSDSIPYVAVIDNVGEITLRGTADYGFWHARLKGEGLVPVQEQGRAKLFISATIGKYIGIRFRELCFLVEATAEVDGGRAVGCCMPHAFNSVRLYAWIERTFFSCPYCYAKVSATLEPSLSVSLHETGETCFEAKLAADATPLPCDEEGWQGPIFLPTSRRRQFFYAKLSGVTEKYAFTDSDLLRIAPHPHWPILDCLVESQFTGTQWLIRRNARHAKSQSINRDATTLRRYGLLVPAA